MNRLETAILWTLLYADVFDYPMSLAEIHHFLIEADADLEEIAQALQNIEPYIAAQTHDGTIYYALHDRAETVFVARKQRAEASAILWPKAVKYGKWLSCLPFVRMVSLTGALAMSNASSADDDLDYMLIVQSGRVWTARLLAVVLVRLVKLWGVTLCPNYVLADDALIQERQDIFIAHEIAQMHLISGAAMYEMMRLQNKWTALFLPNAHYTFRELKRRRPHPFWRVFKQMGEFILSGRIGDMVENWEQERKIRKFQSQIRPDSAAQLDEKHVKGHFKDYGQIVLQKFHARLDTLDLPHPAVWLTEFGAAAAD